MNADRNGSEIKEATLMKQIAAPALKLVGALRILQQSSESQIRFYPRSSAASSFLLPICCFSDLLERSLVLLEFLAGFSELTLSSQALILFKLLNCPIYQNGQRLRTCW